MKQQIADLEQQREAYSSKWRRDKESGLPLVGSEDVARIVSKLTGIPVAQLAEEEKARLLRMEEMLHRRVIGQDEAVSAVSQAIRRARIGLADPNRPIGSFLFLGPTGVGKTELARALAEVLFGDEEAMIRLDMSEFMERHAVSRLIGAPPGYVGYEEAGQLTEAVRRRPYSVVLLDEIEKAHSDVFNILLQILEDGRLTDAKGRTVNFKNTVIIGTSNLGSHLIQAYGGRREHYGILKDNLMGLLKQNFRPEFLNRVDEVIVFQALTQEEIEQVVQLMLRKTCRLLKAQGMGLQVSPEAVKALAREGFDPTFGARPLRRLIQRRVENEVSRAILEGRFAAGDAIAVDVRDGNFVLDRASAPVLK